MGQIIADSMKIFIKSELKNRNYKSCQWECSPDGIGDYCHFIADPECGFYVNERHEIKMPLRDSFYLCNLRGRL